MTDTALIRLMSWLSPVFPTGSYAYSAGLEQAVADGSVGDADSLQDWLETLLAHGSLRNDAILLGAAWRGHQDPQLVCELASLAEALAGSAERHKETMDQGRAFLATACHWFDGDLPASLPLPVAIGFACGRAGIAVQDCIAGYLNTLVSNQSQCAIRLSLIGQGAAARLLARLERAITDATMQARNATPDDLGSIAFMAEIASMNHEMMQPRLFLS